MKKNNIIIILILIIIAALCIFFATKTITSNKENKTNNTNETTDTNEENRDNKEKDNNNSLYQEFIETKEYLNTASSEADNMSNLQYAYYDLNNDSQDELILYASEDNNFGTSYIYTKNGKKVVLISKIYHYGNLSYNTDDSAIVYTEVRPSLSYGYAYGFYKLNKISFKLIKTVGVNIENGNENYFIDDKTITKEEYEAQLKNNISFNYQEIK